MATLITGVTGFIGGATAAHLLTSDPQLEVITIVRQTGSDEATFDRVRQSLHRFLDDEKLPSALSRVTIVTGDIAEEVVYAQPERFARVTHVLHLAACTSFRSIREVRRVNILGALTLAHQARRFPHLKRYVHVGTAFSCGGGAGRLVKEDALDSERGHVVEYTHSKMECEQLLHATAPELPLIVARPSVVLGHTTLGCEPSSSIYWYIRALHRLGRIPFPAGTSSQRDIVPVDWVAEALRVLLYKPDLAYRRYHLSSGETYSDQWEDILAALDRKLGKTIEPDIAKAFDLTSSDADRLATAIELFDRFSALDLECFENQRILAEGVAPPPRFTSYLARCTKRSRGDNARTIMQELNNEA